MWPCCDYTSSDGDEHNTDNNFLLLFADVDIAPALLAGLFEVDVLYISLGCRFALDIFTISQQYCPSPDLEPPPLDSELELYTPNCSLCGQTVRLHGDNCRHVVLPHSPTVRFERLQSQPTTQLFHCLCAVVGCSTG